MMRLARRSTNGFVMAILIMSLIGGAAAAAAEQRAAPQVAQGKNAFALDLYGRLRPAKGNLFFSPYSISTALAMTYTGARGETESQMARVLHFELPQEALHPAFKELIASLQADKKKGYELSVADALWGQQGSEWACRRLRCRTPEGNFPWSCFCRIRSKDFIRDRQVSSILFIGWVMNPTK